MITKQHTNENNTKAWRKFLPCLCCMIVGGVIVPTLSYAQSNDMMNRIRRLENDVQTLSRSVYRGEPPVSEVPHSGPTSMPGDARSNDTRAANTELRLQDLEQEIRQLTGRIEEQDYALRELQYRIEAIENKPEPTRNTPQNASQLSGPESVVPESVVNAQNSTPPSPSSSSTMVARTKTPAALYEEAYAVLKSGDFDKAETMFQSFLDQNPDHTLAPNATYWLGETFYVRNKYKQAAKTFAQSYQKFPNGSKSTDSLLKLGLSLKGMGSSAEACLALKQLLQEYPNGNPTILKRAENEVSALSCAS